MNEWTVSTTCFCFLLSCAYISVNTFTTTKLLCSRPCEVFIQTSCLSTCHTDVSVSMHLQNLTQFSRGKNEKHLQHSAWLVLSDGKIKANPNRLHCLLFLSVSNFRPPTAHSAPMCLQILSLLSVFLMLHTLHSWLGLSSVLRLEMMAATLAHTKMNFTCL